MNEKYRLLNNVEVDFSQYEEENIDELEKKKMMKRFSKSNKKKMRNGNKTIIAVAVALFVVVSLGIYGENVSAIVDSIKHNVSSWLGVDKNYSAEIGETIKESGIEVTLNEFFTDNDRVVLNLEINKKIQPLVDEYKYLIPDLYVNGEKIDINVGYLGYCIGETKGEGTEDRSSVIFETETKGLNLTKKENIKLVFSDLAKRNGIDEERFSYNFIYDIDNYKNDCKVVDVNKKITVNGNNLEVSKVIDSPDRIIIFGNQNGFTPWENDINMKYFYEIVDQDDEKVGLKAAIGEGAFCYKAGKEITSLKVIPYTFEAIDTKGTKIDEEGRKRYVLEDNIITINLK